MAATLIDQRTVIRLVCQRLETALAAASPVVTFRHGAEAPPEVGPAATGLWVRLDATSFEYGKASTAAGNDDTAGLTISLTLCVPDADGRSDALQIETLCSVVRQALRDTAPIDSPTPADHTVEFTGFRFDTAASMDESIRAQWRVCTAVANVARQTGNSFE